MIGLSIKHTKWTYLGVGPHIHLSFFCFTVELLTTYSTRQFSLSLCLCIWHHMPSHTPLSTLANFPSDPQNSALSFVWCFQMTLVIFSTFLYPLKIFQLFRYYKYLFTSWSVNSSKMNCLGLGHHYRKKPRAYPDKLLICDLGWQDE